MINAQATTLIHHSFLIMSDTKRVLFLGPLGTYSHQAALQQFGQDNDVQYQPAKSIPQCFDDLENDKSIAYSVVPLENSTNGQVVFSFDLIRDRMLQCSLDQKKAVPKLKVVGEQYVAITHCLLTSSNKITKIGDLKQYKNVKIYSHPQVWGQVTEYLNKLKSLCPNTVFETIDSSSTSGAVMIAKDKQNELGENNDIIYLSIASETAAMLNKVNIVEHSINDKLGNTTRFLVLRRQEDPQEETQDDLNKIHVSLLTFTTEQDEPGSLVDVLNILKDHSINMCSIHSRPYNSPTSPRKWQYVFFVEFILDQKKNTNLEGFYKQIEGKCLQWCLWGTFPRNQKYYQ